MKSSTSVGLDLTAMIFFHSAVPIYDFHDILIIFGLINISMINDLLYDENLFIPSGKKLGRFSGKIGPSPHLSQPKTAHYSPSFFAGLILQPTRQQ